MKVDNNTIITTEKKKIWDICLKKTKAFLLNSNLQLICGRITHYEAINNKSQTSSSTVAIRYVDGRYTSFLLAIGLLRSQTNDNRGVLETVEKRYQPKKI